MKTKNKIFLGALLGLTLTAAAARAFCLLTRYDPSLGYLTDGFVSFLPALLLCVGSVAALSAPFLCEPSASPCKATGKAESLLHTLTAALFFFGGMLFLINRTTNYMILYIITGLLASAFAIFYFVTCTPDTSKSATTVESLRPWFHLAGIFTLLLLLVSSYFDMTVTINGPFATPTIFSVLCGCVFFLMETRADIGRPLGRLHVAAASLACFFGLAGGASSLAFCLLGDAGSAVTITEPARPMLFLAVGLSAAARLIALLRSDFADVKTEEK